MPHFKRNFLLCALLLVSVDLAVAAKTTPDLLSTEAILSEFVEDFAHDAFAAEVVFGFSVDDERWHMRVESDDADGFRSSLHEGFPEEPILYWEMTRATLDQIHSGMNGETATARARAEDPYPLRTRATDDFPRYLINQDLQDFIERLRLHFWTTGQPEVFALGAEYARESHGANVVGLVYREGLRTMWYQIDPGQHVNEDPADQVNPSHSLMIVTQARATCRFDGEEQIIEAGNAYLIPGGMSHECWNDFDEPMAGILIMYGEGA